MLADLAVDLGDFSAILAVIFDFGMVDQGRFHASIIPYDTLIEGGITRLSDEKTDKGLFFCSREFNPK